MPASGLKRRPKIARKTALAGLAMIQEKAVHAGKAIIVEVMHDRDLPLQGLLVNHRRHDREDVVDLPEIEAPRFPVLRQFR